MFFLPQILSAQLLYGKCVDNYCIQRVIQYVYSIHGLGFVSITASNRSAKLPDRTSRCKLALTTDTTNILFCRLTVAVTTEHCLMVVLPALGKKFSTMFYANLFIAMSIPWAILVHVYYLVVVTTIVNPQCDFHPNWTTYYFVQKPIGR